MPTAPLPEGIWQHLQRPSLVVEQVLVALVLVEQCNHESVERCQFVLASPTDSQTALEPYKPLAWMPIGMGIQARRISKAY